MLSLLYRVGALMKFTKLVAVAILVGSFGAGAVQAQSFRSQPAEFPPSSFKGKQYVDSKGCVFIRAGIDGNTTWVPRVSRKREGVCGFKPTNVASTRTAPSTGASEPVQITLNARPAATAPRAPRVQPRPIPVLRAAPKVVRQTQPKIARQTAPRPVAIAPAAPIAAPKAAPRRVTQSVGGCPGRSALSQQYSGTRASGVAVRCGPQTAPIVGTGRTTAPARTAYVAPTTGYGSTLGGAHSETRIVPKHVAINRLNTHKNVAVPKGYRPVWEDDRLNPKRAEQNLKGRSQMLLIWTNTVPRRLINQSDGRDMTAQLPLVYPYTSIAQQRRELGTVTFAKHNGQLVKKIVRNSGAAPVARKPVYSTRSAAKPAAATPKTKAIGNRYVQVGVFADSANAQRTAQRIANMGMGARIGKSTRGGKTYLSVQAGPFAGSSATNALGKLRGLGFRDAYIR